MGLSWRDHFAINQPFDAVVLDAKSPLIATSSLKNLLSTMVYTGDSSCNLGTIVNGRWVVKQQHHHDQSKIKSKFISTLKNLKSR